MQKINMQTKYSVSSNHRHHHTELLAFTSVTDHQRSKPFNRLSPKSGKWKEVNPNSHAKNQVCAILPICKILSRASDISRKKKQNFAGFSGANSWKNRPISWYFRGKKVKIRGKSADFAGFLREKSQNSPKNRPILRDFSGKKSNFEGFSGVNS